MNRRRSLLLAAGASALALPLAVFAELHDKKMPRIGYLSVASVERDREWLAALRDGLKELGYIEGRNIAIEARHADGYAERLVPLAAELVQRKVYIFIIYGPP